MQINTIKIAIIIHQLTGSIIIYKIWALNIPIPITIIRIINPVTPATLKCEKADHLAASQGTYLAAYIIILNAFTLTIPSLKNKQKWGSYAAACNDDIT